MRKTKPTHHDRELAKKLVQFHCYDVVGIYGNFNEVVASNAPFEDRDEFIKSNWNTKTRYVKTVTTNSLARLLLQQNVKPDTITYCGFANLRSSIQ